MDLMQEKERVNFPQLEEKILKFWEENKIFEKTLQQTRGARERTFAFFEGPPTANGLPHIGHALTRAFKDIILRYKTMRGFYVPRKAGWDTHGLPVEIEVEKQLGFKSKQDIEKFGIGRFNQKAKESVWRYKDEWEKATKRLGFWLDLENPYVTYDTAYMETLWWIMKEAWKKKLLYQGFKIVPWCPRCETGLSSHEVGLGYKKVRENSIYVKLKIKKRKNEFFLVWTTTPWTLPANVAVALFPKTEYTKFKVGDEYIWSLHTPPYEKDQEISVVEKVSGKSLLGIEYEPLFAYKKEYSLGKNPEYVTMAGDFVSTEEGTGLVHIAPAFGEEDMNAAKTLWGSNYPILHTVNSDGTMKKGVIGEGLFAKEADKVIISDLKRRNLLYRIESHEHDYPFCWRCATPLLYFAKTSWWIKMSSLREALIKNNGEINWIPGHLKEGRFGEFLKEVRDWAFSRERYWGTPLPVWQCVSCGEKEAIGSREELALRLGSPKNKYFIMRHGEAINNTKNVLDFQPGKKYPETLRGLLQDEKTAKKLKKEKIDLIFSSDILRARQTAEVVAEVLGIKKVEIDKRLREIQSGALEGRPTEEYQSFFSSCEEKFVKSPPGGETLRDVEKRMMNFLEDAEKKYHGKTILIVSHEYPLWMLYAGAGGLTEKEACAFRGATREKDFIHFAEAIQLTYKKLPRDENGEVNLHRPFVDTIEFPCAKCAGKMKRVPEVVDVWFDSGAMPFAQAHYPFAWPQSKNEKVKSKNSEKLVFPADYICEAIDQTRGWFYTLLAVSTILGRGAPYKNVISLGHVLDKNGLKMSKSKGNVVDPGTMIEKYGADALRWYFYTINAPGDSKRFDEKDLVNQLRNFLGTLWNSFLLFDTYVSKVKSKNEKIKITNVLDQWILIKLELLINDVTKKLDSYDITNAARALEEFTINDFSQWYLRRSRRRFQRPESEKEKEETAQVTAEALLSLAKLAAPFVPFLSEIIFQELRKKMKIEEMSVHLAEWPATKLKNKNEKVKILDEMQMVREIVAAALKLRAQAGIRVRQPLQKLKIKNEKIKSPGLTELIKDEVNVKEVVVDFRAETNVELDTSITPELKEEGMVREIMRNIQEMRRDLGLKPEKAILLQMDGAPEFMRAIEKWQGTIKKDVGARGLKIGGKKVFKIEREMDLEGKSLWLGIEI